MLLHDKNKLKSISIHHICSNNTGMSLFEEIQCALKKELDRRKATNPKYSLRAFAKSLNLSVSRLSEIINNKREPSKIQIKKIHALLGGNSKLNFTNGNSYENKKKFNEGQFELVSNWIYLAVLSFLKEKTATTINPEKYSAKFLAKFFNKDFNEMQSILDTLESTKLIVKKFDKYEWCPGPEKTSDQVSSLAIKTYHKNMLDEAKNKIEKISVNERDFSSIVMMIDSKKIDIAKEEIKSFRRKLSSLLEEGSQDQVFALNIQFIPLSQKISPNHNEVVLHE